MADKSPWADLRKALTKAEMEDETKAALEAALGKLEAVKDGAEGALKVLAELAKPAGEEGPSEEEKAAALAAKTAAETALAKMEKAEDRDEDLCKALGAIAGREPAKPLEKREDLPDDVKAELLELKKSADEDRKKLKELEKAAKERDAEDRRKSYLEKAKDLPHVPGKPEDLGGLLSDIAGHDPKLADKAEALFKSIDAAVSKGDLFSESGSSAEGNAPGSAYGKLLEKAEQLRQKAEGKLTKEQALVQAMRDNPDLVREYNQERLSA